ncbi:MAG TPA: hypothetical protein VKE49_00570 [Myxococcaceae bacterium]|nr:hypothetical protein [Myxococcaceae bacterium]
MTAAPPEKLPVGLRNACLVALVLSAVVGLLSASEALSLLHFSEFKAVPAPRVSGRLESELLEKAREAQLGALEGMRFPRALTLCALSLTCALTFVAAGRLIRPRNVERERMRQLLVFSSIAAALLRTVDGAQGTVVARRVGLALGKMGSEIASLPEVSAEDIRRMFPSAAIGIAVLQTALVAGAFALLWQYFRSQKVKQLLALAGKGP